ncbi:MAG: 50S ribosomal protein L11 methyltransferase [Woeseiaceae bacterium]
MNWQQFSVDLGPLDPEVAEDMFTRHGAQSVTLSDAADNPVLEPAPGEVPLWQETRITGLFAADTDFTALLAELATAFAPQQPPPHQLQQLEDRAWEREWLKDFKPMKFGERLWICPGDMRVEQADAVIVRLDPGLAFGTGTHATTAMCLDWLDSLDFTTATTVLDYGCGSGVLAIAALRLGAASAVAMDIDPQAELATAQNAANNEVAEQLLVLGSDAAIKGSFQVVIANILAGPLTELVDCITSRTSEGGKLALSGVLSAQVLDIMRAYKPHIRFEEPVIREQDGQSWALLSGTRI